MPKILLIDDEINIRTLLTSLLSPDYTVFQANNGKEGLHLFTLHHPDVIITDLNMPYINGIDLVRNMRASRSKVFIIVCSAYLNNPGEVMKAGADLCLPKPIEMAALKKAIDDLFKH
jgi:two-component system, chemotaxis family, chemotaxis protein CheY